MLKHIRRWLSAAFIAASALVGFWVYSENPQPVEVILFGFPVDRQPLGLVIVAIFSAGIIIGLFCNLLMTAWMAFKIKRLQKQLLANEKQLQPGK